MALLFCAGVIPIKKINDQWHVYMVKHAAGHWSFPKGKVEKNETIKQCAERELKEETGLKIDRWVLTRPYFEDYSFEQDGKIVEKNVSYMIAVVKGVDKVDGKEVVEGRWVEIPKAQELATYEETQQSCRELIDTIDVCKIMEILD